MDKSKTILTSTTTTTSWLKNQISLQTVLYFFAAFTWAILFWKDSKDNWNKTEKNEAVTATKASEEEVKDLREQLAALKKEHEDEYRKQGVEIEKALDYQQYWQGYWDRFVQEKK